MAPHSDQTASNTAAPATRPHLDLPACARPFAAELEAIEAELDEIWPDYERVPFELPTPDGGRQLLGGYKLRGRPFTVQGLPAQPYSHAHVVRLKWLLKRHMLLMEGRDWGVHIAVGEVKPHRGRCWAHPTSERRPHPEPPDRVGPPSFAQREPPQPSPARLALESGTAMRSDTPAQAPPRPPWRP